MVVAAAPSVGVDDIVAAHRKVTDMAKIVSKDRGAEPR